MAFVLPKENPTSPSHTFPDLLEQYVATHILSDHQFKQPLWRQALKCIAVLFGIAWGIPWVWASMAAADIFPAPWSSVMAVIFAIGIVFTVGADGWWIMREASQRLDKKSSSEKVLLDLQQGKKLTRWIKIFFAWLFATLSCIAPVYAAVKYTSSKQALFAVITLVGYYGYGLIGYAKLIEKVTGWWRDRFSQPAFLALRTQLSLGIKQLAQSQATIGEATAAKELISEAFLQQEWLSATIIRQRRRKWLQIVFTVLIPPAASVVSIFLIREFLYAHVWDNAVFVLVAAIIAELPGFVMNTLATFHVAGRLWMNTSSRLESAALHQVSPRMTQRMRRVVMLLPAVLALLAPTAAGYITYTTLTAHQVPHFVVILGVVAISLARVVFSWFTLNNLLDHITIKTCAVMGKTSVIRQAYMQSLAETLSRMDAVYFKAWSHN